LEFNRSTTSRGIDGRRILIIVSKILVRNASPAKSGPAKNISEMHEREEGTHNIPGSETVKVRYDDVRGSRVRAARGIECVIICVNPILLRNEFPVGRYLLEDLVFI
jgi:hypothetical protein